MRDAAGKTIILADTSPDAERAKVEMMIFCLEQAIKPIFALSETAGGIDLLLPHTSRVFGAIGAIYLTGKRIEKNINETKAA